MEVEKLIGDLLGRRDFRQQNEIIRYIMKSKYYSPTLDKINDATALLLYKTSKQQTWLVSTKERLYCILDDNREDNLNINWSVPKKTLISNEKLSDVIRTKSISNGQGLVDIGQEKNLYYSEKLFAKTDIKSKIMQEICSFVIRTTTFFREDEQEKLQNRTGRTGLKIYDIRAIIDSKVEGALEKVDRVEYLLPGYPEELRNLKRSDYTDKFFLKELAFGDFELIANVYLKKEESPIELKKWIELKKRGPRIINGYMIESKSDLTNANLEGENLIGADLVEAVLEGANLKGANLQEADLRGANLKYAHLERANLTGAKLSNAKMQGAYLTNAILNCADIKLGRLDETILEKAELMNANLKEVTLIKANLKYAKLNNSDISGSNLMFANLEGADFNGVKMKGVDLRNVVGNVVLDNIDEVDDNTIHNTTNDKIKEVLNKKLGS